MRRYSRPRHFHRGLTLKREEISANCYIDLEHLRANIEEFIERYYNPKLLHSALDYRSPEQFEQALENDDPSLKAAAAGREKRSGDRLI